MTSKKNKTDVRLDVLGLFLAGLINTFLALFVAGIIFGPGTIARQPDLLLRAGWITENSLRWQGGWLFWFAVTLSFAWSYFALGRHLQTALPWCSLAIGVALIAAAVDLLQSVLNARTVSHRRQGDRKSAARGVAEDHRIVRSGVGRRDRGDAAHVLRGCDRRRIE